MFDYWQDYPPTHVLVAAYLMGGNKRPSNKRRGQISGGNSESKFDELARAVSSAGGSINKKLPAIYKT